MSENIVTCKITHFCTVLCVDLTHSLRNSINQIQNIRYENRVFAVKSMRDL